jgi:hypothetical protein
MKDTRLTALVQIAHALSDRRLGAYHEAGARCQETRSLMRALDAPPADDLPLVSAAQAQLAYGVWADRRRAHLHRLLQDQIAEANQRRDEAALAFGKAHVLGVLADRQGR